MNGAVMREIKLPLGSGSPARALEISASKPSSSPWSFRSSLLMRTVEFLYVYGSSIASYICPDLALAAGAHNHLTIFLSGHALALRIGGPFLHRGRQVNALYCTDLGKALTADNEAGFRALANWLLLLWHRENLSHRGLICHGSRSGLPRRTARLSLR